VIVDANVLLYARNADDPRHPKARAWLEGALNGTTRVGLPWWTLAAFVRISTNARAFPSPLSPDEAVSQIEEWLDAPRAWLAEPTGQYWHVLAALVRDHDVRGPLGTDAQLAALAIDHGVAVVSTDADFARFRSVEWIDPLR
jgi:hypothetical protein